MKLLIIFVFGLATLATASATTCKAQLIHTICGSGKVEVTFDTQLNTFSLSNGDVRCWLGDDRQQGQLKYIGAVAPYYLENNFNLEISDIDYGKLTYDPKLLVARLEILGKSENSLLSSTYNLICD